MLFRILKITDLEVKELYYKLYGILQYETPEVSGEKNFICNILPKIVNSNDITIFDVGANCGEYTEELYRHWNRAEYYLFEPATLPFNELKNKFGKNENININNFALGSKDDELFLYGYGDPMADSPRSSLYKGVIEEFFNIGNKSQEMIKVKTINNFCSEKSINKIDFIKIDTEGHELEVLKGADNLIKKKLLHAYNLSLIK